MLEVTAPAPPFEVPEVSTATPGFARAYARNRMAREQVSRQAAEAIELIVSELATNVVLHVGGPIHLEVEVDPNGLIEVRCKDSSPMATCQADSYGTEAGHGYGLLLVSMLAKSMTEVGAEDGGKVLIVTIDPAHLALV